MVKLRFILYSFRFNITLNLFRIHAPLRSNQFMIIECTIFRNSSTHDMMMIFLMLTSRCFRLDWWLPLLQKFIQSLLCSFIKMEELMLQSQIACHTFLCSYQPRPLWKWLIETRYMHKEMGFFYVDLLSVSLYIYWDQFNIFQVTLPTPCHQVLSNFILGFKRLHLNPLNIVTFLT